jgi:hypothetical protein
MTRVVRTRLNGECAWRSSKAMRDSAPGVGFPLREARRLEVS